MKKTTISRFAALWIMSLLMLYSWNALSQIVIGKNTISFGVLLEVEASPTSAGIVLPEADIMDLTTLSPFPSGTEIGTLVFNTNLDSGPGYYFWDGTAWVRFVAYVGQSAKYSNTAAPVNSGNLNDTAGGNVQIVGSNEFNDNTALYVADGTTGIRINETGIYQVTVALSLVGTYGTTGSPARNSRAEIDARINVNNADRGPLYRSTEMNMTSAAGDVDYGSLSFTQSVKINAGQILTLRYRASKNENVGVVRLRSVGTSTIYIQKTL